MYVRPSALTALTFAIESARKFEYPADRTLSYVLREQRVGSLDRPIVAEGYYAWLRHRMSVEAIAGDDAKKPIALALAALARIGVLAATVLVLIAALGMLLYQLTVALEKRLLLPYTQLP